MNADDLRSMTLQQLLESLAARTPAPGGGAIAPIVAALAAALANMVLQYSVGKKSLAQHEATNRLAITQLQDAIRALPELASDDMLAYCRLNSLFKLDPSDPRRVREWADAVKDAINTPLRALTMSNQLLELFRSLTTTTNRMLASDLAIAALLAEAAARAAAWNVRINLPLLEPPSERKTLEMDLKSQLLRAQVLANEIDDACRSHM